MRVGIEIELHSNGYDCDYIAQKEWLNFETFVNIKWTDVWVKLSREYYTTTIEYNFTPFEVDEVKFLVIKDFIEKQIKKYNLEISVCWPAYVWTHIHIFDDNLHSARLSPFLNRTMWFIVNNLEWLNINSVDRLFRAHQLWGNYSHRNKHNWLNFLKSIGHSPYIYNNCKDKPKYNPVIHSPAVEWWKPKSLEIRIIPNEYILNMKAYELMKWFKDKSLKNTTSTQEFVNIMSDRQRRLYRAKFESNISKIMNNPASYYVDYWDIIDWNDYVKFLRNNWYTPYKIQNLKREIDQIKRNNNWTAWINPYINELQEDIHSGTISMSVIQMAIEAMRWGVNVTSSTDNNSYANMNGLNIDNFIIDDEIIAPF